MKINYKKLHFKFSRNDIKNRRSSNKFNKKRNKTLVQSKKYKKVLILIITRFK